MRNAGPESELRLDASLPRAGGEAQRIVAQKLVLGDMDQERRKAQKLGVARRAARVEGRGKKGPAQRSSIGL